MKILSIVGARPQFIKAAAVSRVLRQTRGMTEVLVHTGQHYDENMSDVFFRELEIPQPNVNLGIGSGTHGDQTGRMLSAIERTIIERRPDRVLVYGDTNSTLAGALAAAKLKVPVAHVEAGLRSYNRAMPEEINRVVADHVSDMLFAPTDVAVKNLVGEGIGRSRIAKVGDVMYDAALFYSGKAQRNSQILEKLALTARGYVLATIHRAENADNPRRLTTILRAFAGLSRDMPVVLPLHPRTVKEAKRLGPLVKTGIRIIPPVGYLDMIMLERHARLIATDSGGVQKEAFFYRVPCVTLRTETEWTELVEAGWNTLLPPTRHDLERRLRRVLARPRPLGSAPRLYGAGRAAHAIVEKLRHGQI